MAKYQYKINNKVKEASMTGTGASFSPGSGENYATPYAFNKNTNAKGTKNIYYYKLGYKPVNRKALNKQAKGIEVKNLWTEILNESDFNVDNYLDSVQTQDPKLKEFIKGRINGFNTLEKKLNVLIPLMQRAKQDTITAYQQKPSYEIVYGTDLANDYIDDLITMFKK
jgi:hypothetical protein